MSKTIAELIEESGGTALLDQLYLPSEGGDRVGVRFGLGVELYMHDMDRAAVRARLIQVAADYCHRFPEMLNRLLEDGKRRARKLSGDPSELLRNDMQTVPLERGYGFGIFGVHPSRIKNDDVSPYAVSALVSRIGDVRLSFCSAYMPIGAGKSPPRDNFLVVLETMLYWCSVCRPAHGTAGLSVLFEPSAVTGNAAVAVPVLKRFPGFDFVDGLDFSHEARSVHNRIKCVNWLTALNDGLVAETGGLSAMRAALEPVCRVHEYPGGVVIQAGEVPQLGDTHRQDIPEAYRLVARYTRPIRFEGYRSGLFQVPQGLDELDETLAWIRRFD